MSKDYLRNISDILQNIKRDNEARERRRTEDMENESERQESERQERKYRKERAELESMLQSIREKHVPYLSNEDGEGCPICLSPFCELETEFTENNIPRTELKNPDNYPVRITTCGHMFHQDCLRAACQTAGNTLSHCHCPICRRVFNYSTNTETLFICHAIKHEMNHAFYDYVMKKGRGVLGGKRMRRMTTKTNRRETNRKDKRKKSATIRKTRTKRRQNKIHYYTDRKEK